MCDILCSYKGEGVVSGSPDKVWECLKPVPNGLRVKWDNNVKRFELLEQITEVCSKSLLSDNNSVSFPLISDYWIIVKAALDALIYWQ